MYKTYINYIEEIMPEELYDGLLGEGLFTEKLPPIFSSNSFCEWCKKEQITGKGEPLGYTSYESIRNVSIPRPMAIPNPFAYERLCKLLEDNWNTILEYFREKTIQNKHKVSRIHIRKRRGTKSIFKMNYNNRKLDSSPLIKMSLGKKYIVRSDITSCFPSIYSHSLSWALVGKIVAKERKADKESWFNKLDLTSRNVKNGETNGLLIGPHASNLLSEIILVAVDQELVNKGYSFIRNIDDYSCVTESYDKAEMFIKDLVTELKKFNLLVNQKKTKIEKLPATYINDWVHIMNGIPTEGKYGVVEFPSVQKYLDQAIQQIQLHQDDATPLNYAIKVLSKLNLSASAQEYTIDMILHMAIIYPYILPILQEFVFDCYKVESSVLEEFISLLYNDSYLRRNYEGVAYALFWALEYTIKIKSYDVGNVLEGNCISKVFEFLYCKKFKITEGIEQIKQYTLSLLDGDFDDEWLLVYETLNVEELEKQNRWTQLKKAQISFIKDKYHYGECQ